MMQRKSLTGIVLLMLFAHSPLMAQLPLLQQQLLRLTGHSDSVINNLPPEKIYIQFDRPEYTVGDTIWFKAYMFNAASHLLSSRSGLLHIDIANDSNKVVKQYLFGISNGLCPGNITMSEKEFKQGNYVMRAYTQWMRNFSADGFYYNQIRLAEAGENAWLVNSRTDTSAGGTHIRARLQITRLDKVPMGDSIFRAKVMNGRKVLYDQKLQGDKNGLLDVSFTIPSGIKPSVVIENKRGDKRAVIPVTLNRPQNTDVQFMPEGGNIVAGLPDRIGFKAIGEDGKGVDVSGVVVDREGGQVATFSSMYKGVGVFELEPRAGEQYNARIILPGGLVKNYLLPLPKLSGINLRVSNAMQSDSVEIELRATSDLQQNDQPYFILAKDRGVVCYAAVVNFQKKGVIKRMISKDYFPTGIVHFILMTTEGQPLNERLVYIDREDELNINIESYSHSYAPKDSITLHLKVTNKDGRPVSGLFSMAVTDDAQVRTDSLDDDNILNRMLITSDIKGYVETPGYYLQRNERCHEALDNLLLTQGWVSYAPLSQNIAYSPEKEYGVAGSVNNVFNLPVKKTDVLLFSSHPSIVMDTLTDEHGRFLFNRFPRVDTPVFVLQARNRHGKSFNVNIKVDEMTPPVFIAPTMPALMPWYVNIDTTTTVRLKNNIAANKLDYIPGTIGHQLKEVKVVGKKIVKGSENLNGPGNSDIVLDEKDVEAAGKKSWLQILQETIPGFHVGMVKKKYVVFITDRQTDVAQFGYYIKDKPVKLIIDGVSFYNIVRFGEYDMMLPQITDFLKSHSAEDIKGVEINSSTKYTFRYVPIEWSIDIQPNDVAFIEITTRSGHGAVLKNTPGVYLYKPLALTWPKQFYKPRYAVNDTSHMVDLRPTIDWEPNVVTDEHGEATISFYAGSVPATYTILVQGTDANGLLGFSSRKLRIEPRKPDTNQ